MSVARLFLIDRVHLHRSAAPLDLSEKEVIPTAALNATIPSYERQGRPRQQVQKVQQVQQKVQQVQQKVQKVQKRQRLRVSERELKSLNNPGWGILSGVRRK